MSLNETVPPIDKRASAGGAAAVYLDRDGVIIENRDAYVRDWADVAFLPGALAALRRLARAPYRVVLVTNQSAVGRGLVPLARAEAITARVAAAVRAAGGRVDGWYLCPHRPGEGCACRKPAPGLLLRAAAELGLDPARSYLVGDALTDLQAARAAGARGVLVLTGRGRAQAALLAAEPGPSWPVVADLGAAVEWILARPARAA